MKNKYFLASIPLFLGVACLIISGLVGSEIASDGMLIEPFFLIPISYLLFFSGIISLLFVAVISMIKKTKTIDL